MASRMGVKMRTHSPYRYDSNFWAPRRRSRECQEDWDVHFNALLADLQNTVSPNSLTQSGVSANSGYGSLNGAKPRDPGVDYGATKCVTTERYETREVPSSPTYQNQKIIKETVTKTQSSGAIPSLNNNLSELDNLLQDLSNAHYASYNSERKDGITNSPSSTYGKRSPAIRPSVDSLLDELNSGLPNGDVRDGITSVTTVKETRTESGGYPHTGASSATKELDDLMASLSDFKVNSGSHGQIISDSQYAKPNKAKYSASQTVTTTTTTYTAKQDQLDSMLGNLQADMSRQGINTTQKGCCFACEKPIVGQVTTALGKTWHPEHFTCNHCHQDLGTRSFFERDGHAYCELDYHNLFSPRCAYCNGPIMDKCITAMEKTWHKEHFFCAQCGKQFGPEGFHERDGKPYCRDDFYEMFAPKCGGCNQSIMENYVTALNSQWHVDCFVCRECKKSITDTFYPVDGKPQCGKCMGVEDK